MVVSLRKPGETSINLAQRAVRETMAERNARRHMKEIEYLLERYTVVQEQYMEKEKDLTRSIINVLNMVQLVKTKRSETEPQLSYKRDELSDLKRELTEAEDRLRSARNRRAAFAIGARVAATAGVASIPLTLVTAGLVAPVAVAVGVGTASAVGASGVVAAVMNAQIDVDNICKKVEDTEAKIRKSESKVHSLSREISQHNSQKTSYFTQYEKLQEENGKVKEVIAFLLDAKSKFSTATRDCIDSTAHTQNIAVRAEKMGVKDYCLFDTRGTRLAFATFEEAWDAFEEMNMNASNYNFEIYFQCTQCRRFYQEFPQVNNGQLICFSCHNTQKYWLNLL